MKFIKNFIKKYRESGEALRQIIAAQEEIKRLMIERDEAFIRIKMDFFKDTAPTIEELKLIDPESERVKEWGKELKEFLEYLRQ